MERIKSKTIELIGHLQNGNLTKSSLRDYYRLVLNDFEDLLDFENYSYYRFSGSLFGVMLEIDDFEDDPEVRQSIASLGFYILSKGMEKFCLNNDGHFLADKSIEQIELISSRISLLLESNASIKYLLRLSKPNTNPYYTPLMDRYEDEARDYSDILLCDSYSVKYLCTKPGNAMFMNEASKFGNQVYERFADYGNIPDRIENGRDSQIRLYKYLKNRFENNQKYTFD